MAFLMLLGVRSPAAEIKGAMDTQWIEDLGGAAIRDPAGRITGVDLRASWVTDTDLRRLVRLPYLTHLDLSLTRITDQGMQELKNLPGIVDLSLYYAEYVTDEGMAAIKGWRKLKRLNIHGAKFSDTTLEHISGITALESLNIGSGMVTDIGLERLTSLPNLKELTIGGKQADRCRLAGSPPDPQSDVSGFGREAGNGRERLGHPDVGRRTGCGPFSQGAARIAF